MNKEIIIVVPSDFTVLQNGAHARFKDLIAWISAHFKHVRVYGFSNHESYPWTSESRSRFATMFPNVELILEYRSFKIKFLTKIKNTLLAFFPSKAHTILAWHCPSATPIYDEFSKNPENYFFIVNYVDSMTVLNGVHFKHYLIDTHDIKFVNWAKTRNLDVFNMRVLARLRSEFATLAIAPALIAISTTELAIFKTLSPKTTCFFMPRIAHQALTFNGQAAEFYLYDLVFVGSDNQFNVEGIVAFLANNIAWINHRQIAIVGKVCESRALKALAEKHNNIKLLGYVDSVTSIYQQTKAAISPVDGTGLKIKILDALNHGLPVFASNHSMDGLPEGYSDAVLPLNVDLMADILDHPEKLNHAKHCVKDYWSTFDKNDDKEALLSYIGGM